VQKPIDWDRIAERMLDVQRAMVHDEQWTGPGFYAEMLRRTFEYTPAGQPDAFQRVLSYEQIRVPGLTTQAEADHTRDGHTIIDRLNRERAEQQVTEMRAEVQRVYREAGADLAKLIRSRCNERTVPSRYRREGVEWAADLIDPAVPKDRYGDSA
jgi:hypothetical protein